MLRATLDRMDTTLRELSRDRSLSYQDLRAAGMTRRQVRWALAEGLLVRARRDVYLTGEAPELVVAAQRVGGRLDCLSALQAHGVFVLDNSRTHVQVDAYDSRLRSPRSRFERLRDAGSCGLVVHWRTLQAPPEMPIVPVLHALAQAARCQPARAMIASIDSALHQSLLLPGELDDLFALWPASRGALRAHLDGRAEAGSETFARILARSLGCKVEVQKTIPGVGRVDLLLDGWLVIECDSRAHHGGWERQERDRLRDLELAARGYTCIRPTAHMIFRTPDVLTRAIVGLLESRRGV